MKQNRGVLRPGFDGGSDDRKDHCTWDRGNTAHHRGLFMGLVRVVVDDLAWGVSRKMRGRPAPR